MKVRARPLLPHNTRHATNTHITHNLLWTFRQLNHHGISSEKRLGDLPRRGFGPQTTTARKGLWTQSINHVRSTATLPTNPSKHSLQSIDRKRTIKMAPRLVQYPNPTPRELKGQNPLGISNSIFLQHRSKARLLHEPATSRATTASQQGAPDL
jgi:hypothetical protein